LVYSPLASSANQAKRGGIVHEFAIKARLLEINPRSPLIEGLLRRIRDLPTDEDERDLEAEEELKEVASILIDGALVRSGFEVSNNNRSGCKCHVSYSCIDMHLQVLVQN
jgi:heat shock protein beta